MKYLSVCSGIEAASVAWKPLGWSCVGVSEIEKFPCSVLKHRMPDVSNLGDMTMFEEWNIEPESVDLLVGGTPCQSFSVAGLRGGLSDGRGNLALTYCRILQKFRPRWFVWENVPGVLSSNGGRDFGSIIGAMEELGYGIAWRVLDAQYFGVPQRRRRVFVVGCARDWRRAAEVLFEPGCLRGDSAKGGKAGSQVARSLTGNSGGVSAKEQQHSFVSSDGVMLNPLNVSSTGHTSHCLNAGGMGRQDYETETMVVDVDVRRLTPVECERLQGFPDDWTLVPNGPTGKPAADGPRYKAIGNSMAVPVMRWIGERIDHNA